MYMCLHTLMSLWFLLPFLHNPPHPMPHTHIYTHTHTLPLTHIHPHRSMTQKQEADTSALAATCNHISHPTTNGPINDLNPEAMDVSSPTLPHRNLRSSRDLLSPSRQFHIPIYESQLVRQKIRRRFSDGDMAGDSLADRSPDGLVVKGGPALNLRHRPYTINKSGKSWQ